MKIESNVVTGVEQQASANQQKANNKSYSTLQFSSSLAASINQLLLQTAQLSNQSSSSSNTFSSYYSDLLGSNSGMDSLLMYSLMNTSSLNSSLGLDTNSYLSNLGNINSSSSSSSYLKNSLLSAYSSSYNTDLLTNLNQGYRFNEINPEKLNQSLGGKLTGMGEVFYQAGKIYNIDPALLAAISQHETGNGKSSAAISKNNVAGMMGKDGLKSYTSVEDSILDMARNLSVNYLGQGLSTISQIGAKYAPIGASNDPTGLNNHWVSGVTKYYSLLKI